MSTPASRLQSMYPSCKKCGSLIGAGANWCRNCGDDLRPARLRLRLPAVVAVGVVLLPVLVAIYLHHGQAFAAGSIKEVANDQVAAVMPEGIQLAMPVRVAISRDRSTVAYVGEKGAEQCLCVNNSVAHCGFRIGEFVVSDDGRRVAWSEAVRNTVNGEVSWHVVVDGGAGPNYLQVGGLQIASDSGSVGYIARTKEGVRFVFDGSEGPVYRTIVAAYLAPRGNRSCYLARIDNRFVPVVDGTPGPAFDSLNGVVFSADGRHLAYAGRDRDGTFTNLDGHRNTETGDLTAIALNADGSRLCRLYQSRGGIWLSEGQRTSPVMEANGATVSYSLSGIINLQVNTTNSRVQAWAGSSANNLRMTDGIPLAQVFQSSLWKAASVLPGAGLQCDRNLSCASLEPVGKELRWRVFPWPPTHFTAMDMATRDPQLRETRDAILAAIHDRSAERLLSYVDPNIRTGFGDPCCGVDQFRRAFDLDNRNSPFWDEAQRVIGNGGLMSNDRGMPTFVAPYTNALPLQALGPLFGTPGEAVGLATGDGTKLLAEPRAGAKALATLNWEPVAALQEPESASHDPQWTRVRTMNGLEGYLERARFASYLDRRAIFAQRYGRWVLAEYVIGD